MTFHTIVHLKSQRLPKRHCDDEARNLDSTLTFFFGRCTSSFIEAHLFKVLSRLKEKWPEDENCSDQGKHQNRFIRSSPEINPIMFANYVLTGSASGLDVQPDPEGNLVCPWHDSLNLIITGNCWLLCSLSLSSGSK